MTPLATVGLVGGLAWPTSAAYYRLINERAHERLGGSSSVPIVMYSFDYEEVEPHQLAGRWDEAAALLTAAAQRVERAGVDLVVLCTNTLHRVADQVQAEIGVPLLHMGDAVADGLRARGLGRVGLLGSRSTMEQPFLRGRLEQNGIGVLVPDEAGRAEVHRVIFEELVDGRVEPDSQRRLLDVAAGLGRAGAQALLLANFELELTLGDGAAPLPTLQSVALHAEAAADRAIGER